jgi:hypothetical protein
VSAPDTPSAAHNAAKPAAITNFVRMYPLFCTSPYRHGNVEVRRKACGSRKSNRAIPPGSTAP